MVFNSDMVSFDQLYSNLSYTFRLPKKKSNFCNIKYLSQLYAGTAYDLIEDLKSKSSALDPPSNCIW